MKYLKLVFTSLIAIFTLISCNKTEQNTTANNEKLANEKLVKQYFEHFNNHEWAKMANMIVQN